MSLLPQRKKSAEEIAKLRESLGIPGVSPADGPAAGAPSEVETIVPGPHEATVVHEDASPPSEPATHLEAPPAFAPHETHSLRRADHAVETPEPPPRSPVPRKPVRSLRKSEQGPLPGAAKPAAAPGTSKLPAHRHSDGELSEIRRREALASMTPAPNPRLAFAHPSVLVPGYLLSLGGAACFFFEEFPMPATAGCSAAALFIAGFVFLKKPISRHHAAFIAVIALFVLVFGALHYFPNLRHAT